MSEKQKPRTNPRAGSNDPDLWDTELDWYFNDFESVCGLESAGTSGAGENRLNEPSKAEKLDRLERIKSGFLLTLPTRIKRDASSTSATEADRAFVYAQAHGIFAKGRRVWQRVCLLPYSVQQALCLAYEERIPEAGANWGRLPLTDALVRQLHRAYRGEAYTWHQEARGEAYRPPATPWINPEPVRQWDGGKGWPKPQAVEVAAGGGLDDEQDPVPDEPLDLVELLSMSEESGLPISDLTEMEARGEFEGCLREGVLDELE